MTPLTDEQSATVAANVKLAYEVANRFCSRKKTKSKYQRYLDRDELIEAALFGLTLAVKGFKPELGWKLSTYAVPSMVNQIFKAIAKAKRHSTANGAAAGDDETHLDSLPCRRPVASADPLEGWPPEAYELARVVAESGTAAELTHDELHRLRLALAEIDG